MEKILEQITKIKESLERLKGYEELEQKIGMSLREFVDLHFVEEKEEEEIENISSGDIVSQEVIDEIKSGITITNHALKRLEWRSGMVVRFENGSINYKETIRNIKYRINHRILAYYNTDGSINIAINRYNYFVFAKDEERNVWVLITYKEQSYNDNDVFYKRKLALQGIERN